MISSIAFLRFIIDLSFFDKAFFVLGIYSDNFKNWRQNTSDFAFRHVLLYAPHAHHSYSLLFSKFSVVYKFHRHRQVNGGKGVTEHLFENYAAAMD
ncbi:hypothetical protein Bandiella_01320 [Candidatus Bandiella woodruffii]|uniref:Uncharacterized protein n=1 Tax=Candidatus Bandiella euplotis TaxID=1664265 RepID=A0ABZ0UM21_9RICK|nr:hypothetical protein Bandiella_01320 [Candidatus Bandiella woodruffii]